MINHILNITQSIVDSFLHVWPYLLVTIPLAVAVNISGAARYIKRALGARPMIAIFLATLVGAFSPFCSCGVIPVVAALLMGGVPLAPVMTFWIASPSMDPEIFFLSVAALGWKLAVWRLAATLIMSLSAGFITYFVVQRGWIGQDILRTKQVPPIQKQRILIIRAIKDGWRVVKRWGSISLIPQRVAAAAPGVPDQTACCASPALADAAEFSDASLSDSSETARSDQAESQKETSSCGSGCGSRSFSQRLLRESWKASTMVVKFMLLAFFLKAVITLYVPAEWISSFLGAENSFAIFAAALIGIPVYTSNLSALPLMSGLLAQGMSPATALAFLIAGPTTTLPAMAAVWGITNRRVFALYLSFSLFGALLAGYIYSLFAGF